jgi:hypothetical protein
VKCNGCGNTDTDSRLDTDEVVPEAIKFADGDIKGVRLKSRQLQKATGEEVEAEMNLGQVQFLGFQSYFHFSDFSIHALSAVTQSTITTSMC